MQPAINVLARQKTPDRQAWRQNGRRIKIRPSRVVRMRVDAVRDVRGDWKNWIRYCIAMWRGDVRRVEGRIERGRHVGREEHFRECLWK